LEYISLKGTDVRVSRIGFGCCPMGGYGWGQTNEDDFIQAVQDALDKGINFFDTADIYGVGVSEMVLGKSLRNHRGKAVIATKFGVRRGTNGSTFYDNSSQWINSALDASLKRLGTDYIDLYQVHYWDTVTSPEVIFESLEKARKSGKIRYFGVTNINLMNWAMSNWPGSLVSFSFEYSLSKRDNENTISTISEKSGLSFFSWGSLGQGMLSGKYNEKTELPEGDRRRRDVYVNFHGEKLMKNLEIVNEMRLIQTQYPDKTLSQIALRWILDRFENSVALVGIKRPEQIIENISALDWNLTNNDLQRLDTVSKK
jgi:myo-inositol catabolism protein IolS